MSAEDELIAEIIRQGQEITRLRLEAAARGNRIAAALTVCDQVEANSVGWGGTMAVSLARTIREALTRPIPPGACPCGHPADDHDDEGACMHLCDCAWPLPPGEGEVK